MTNYFYFVTGAAGSIGSALVKKLVENKDNHVDAFDNNEYGLAMLRSEVKARNLRVLVGDVRDKERLETLLATEPYNVVIHLAALKRVETAEQNVVEAIKTNVEGTINLTEACIKTRPTFSHRPDKFLLISSDKAVPAGDIGLYGATKFLQEKIVLSCPVMKCSVARFGNVKGTRGDVFEIWKKQAENSQHLTLTDSKARRFYWSMKEAVQFIVNCLYLMKGGEIFVPLEMKEYNMLHLLTTAYPKASYKVTGLRPGEVLVHKLMTESERLNAERTEWGWVIK